MLASSAWKTEVGRSEVTTQVCGISTPERGIDWNFHVTPGIQRGSGEEENTVRVAEKMHLTQ